RRHTRWPRDWSSDVCSSDLKVLSPDRDLRALRRCNRGAQINVRWANDNFVACVASHEREKLAKEFASLSGILVHLPVGGDEFLSRHCLFQSQRCMVCRSPVDAEPEQPSRMRQGSPYQKGRPQSARSAL